MSQLTALDLTITNGNEQQNLKLLHQELRYMAMITTMLHLSHRREEPNQAKQIEIMKTFCDGGIDMNVKNKEGKTDLRLAIEFWNTVVINFCIQQHDHLDVTDHRGNTVAHFIIEEEYRKYYHLARYENVVELEKESSTLVEWMISRGIDFFNPQNKKNESPIYLAFKFNLQHILLTLLKYITDFSSVERDKIPFLCAFLRINANPNVYFSSRALKPINSKFYNCCYDIVKITLEKNKSISDETLAMALHTAIRSNQEMRVIELLLKNTVNVIHYVNGKSLIQYFTNNLGKLKNQSQIEGEMTILRTLVHKGADINERESNRETIALKCFRLRPYLKMIKLLQHCEADFNARTVCGDSFLHLASQFNNEAGMIGSLAKEGCDVNMLNCKGKTPLEISIIKKNYFVAMDLIEHGASVHVTSWDSKNPLSLASERGQIEVVKKLMEYGADLEYRDKNNATPLSIACEKGRIKVAKELIEFGADLGYRDENHKTLLHLSVDNPKMMELLVQYKVDIDAKDNKGKTPLHYAKNAAVIKILFNAGAQIDIIDNNADSPLYIAMTTQNLKKTFELLKSGADLLDAKMSRLVDGICRQKYVLNDIDRLYKSQLKEHLVKLTAAGMLDKVTNALNENALVNNEFYKTCQKEVESLKKYFIDDSTSLYKLLQKNKNRRCAYVDNEKLKNLVEQRTLARMFPKYDILILCCYNEAVARKPLLEKVTCIFNRITIINLPDLCTDQIFSYLSNVNLVSFIDACAEISSRCDTESAFIKSNKKLKIKK